MEHMNTFNRMISDLLRLDVKLDVEDGTGPYYC